MALRTRDTEFLDWFIRLDSRGPREQCLRKIMALLANCDSMPASPPQHAVEPSSSALRQVADILIGVSAEPLSIKTTRVI